MTAELAASGEGLILPAREKIILDAVPVIEVEIVEAHPENGYDKDGNAIESENIMVKVKYPTGIEKNHQVKNITDLMTKISFFLKARFNIQSFNFSSATYTISEGNIINLEDVSYDA